MPQTERKGFVQLVVAAPAAGRAAELVLLLAAGSQNRPSENHFFCQHAAMLVKEPRGANTAQRYAF